MHWLLKTHPKKLLTSIRSRVLPNLGHLSKSRARRCRCCERRSVFLQFSEGEELTVCLRCRANLRYEMLAEHIRERLGDLGGLDVLELDRGSPLQPLLSGARSYARSYFDPADERGSTAADGAVMQDVTHLTYEDCSFDLIVSSEVLEHVPDLSAAFRETERVLRPGGVHLFTVPPHDRTVRLASMENGTVRQIVLPPEYHGDNNSHGGILAFWHFGPDFADHIDVGNLDVRIVKGPEGLDRRVVWQAKRASG